MPVWAYLVIGFVILALVLLTFRRNLPVVHQSPQGYGDDFARVLDQVGPALDQLRDAVRQGEERSLAMAAARARSRVREAISDLDRLNIAESIPDEQSELLESFRVRLRRAMESYEWAARIAETTDLIENEGLRRGFDSLLAAGDQLCVESRLQLVAFGPAPGET